jgi:uncharacterized RDD family membrane protein YckC
VLLDDRLEIETPEGVALDLALSGLGSRILARLLDSVVQYGILYLLQFVVGFGIGAVGFASGDGSLSGWIIGFVIIFYFLLFFAYDIVFELAWDGQTPGKRALGIRVVRSGGRRTNFLSSTIRNVLRVIDILPTNYLVGSVSIWVTKTNQRLGDLAGGTYVVRMRSGEARDSAIAWAARPTVPYDAVAAWDVSAVSDADMVAVRRFLDRRLTLDGRIRYGTSVDLAQLLFAKVHGLPPSAHPEYIIEGVAVAKEQRR